MSKPNKDGWIRHRGGKCPVGAGVAVDYRMRADVKAGVFSVSDEGAELRWSHGMGPGDIMAFRIHKPAEQVEPVSEEAIQVGIDAADAGKLTPIADVKARFTTDGPLQWRDRIAEIDATTQALTAERAELVQKLASEGFALIGRVVEPVEDYGNIQIGDLVSVISIGGFSDCTGLSVGDIVEVTSVDNDGSLKTVSGGSWGSIGYNYKFHSRPSA